MAQWPQWVSYSFIIPPFDNVISGTNYKSQVQDSFSISSSHHGSSDFTQATNVPKFNIHLPASLQPATFSPPPPTQVKDKHEMAGERITRRHTTRHGETSGHEQKKNTAKRTQSQYQQRRRASYNHQRRRHESVKKKHYSSTESDSESSYSEDGLWTSKPHRLFILNFGSLVFKPGQLSFGNWTIL